MRNRVLFDDIGRKSLQVCFAINTLLIDYSVPCLKDKVRCIGKMLVLKYPVDFFTMLLLVVYVVLILFCTFEGHIYFSLSWIVVEAQIPVLRCLLYGWFLLFRE